MSERFTRELSRKVVTDILAVSHGKDFVVLTFTKNSGAGELCKVFNAKLNIHDARALATELIERAHEITMNLKGGIVKHE